MRNFSKLFTAILDPSHQQRAHSLEHIVRFLKIQNELMLKIKYVYLKNRYRKKCLHIEALMRNVGYINFL